MLNIKQELNLIDDFDEILIQLNSQKKELEKKQHLFKILRFVDSLEKLIDNDYFRSLNIERGSIAYCYDRIDNAYLVFLNFINANNLEIKYSDDKPIRNICKFPGNLDIRHINEDLEIDKLYYFEFNNDMKKNLLNLFLSTELKAALEYNEIDNELDSKKETVSKKPKL